MRTPANTNQHHFSPYDRAKEQAVPVQLLQLRAPPCGMLIVLCNPPSFLKLQLRYGARHRSERGWLGTPPPCGWAKADVAAIRARASPVNTTMRHHAPGLQAASRCRLRRTGGQAAAPRTMALCEKARAKQRPCMA